MKMRDITKMRTMNDAAHTRTLYESVMLPEVIMALKDWAKVNAGGVLIGGVGLSYHIRPRMTQDLDFLFMNFGDIPEQVPGFKRHRQHAFQHNKTHVEVEVVAPENINVPREIAAAVFETSMFTNNLRVASESGLVALKLFRLSRQDEADIIALVKTGRVDLSPFPLSVDKIRAFQELNALAATDPHPV